MAYSYTVFTGNGSTTQYAVSFSYIRREHVAVTVAGIPSTFTWVNNSLIQMDAAPANGAAVRVYRTTPISAPLVDFADGSTLVAADLDTNSRQSIYIQQELDDAQQDNLPNVIPNGNKGEITTSVGGTVWAINNGAVTEVKLAANAVTSGKIADGTIVNADVNASADITAGKLSFTQAGTGATARTVDAKLKDTVSAEDFGAVGNNPAGDDWPALQAAINTGKPVVLLGKTYYISKPLEAEYFNLQGAGFGSSLTPSTAKTVIKKTTNAVGTTATRDGISYAVDSVISIVHPLTSFSKGVQIKGVSFEGISNASRNAYVVYAPRIAQFKFDTILMSFGVVGFYSTSAYDARLDHVQAASCTTGWQVVTSSGGSTSWTANNISTNACASGFSFNKLNYSTFNSCYAESTTVTAWSLIAAQNVVLNGCGGEGPTGKVLSLNTASIVVNGWQSGQIVGASGVDAITVVDSNLTFINSLVQNFSAVNGAKIMTVTGPGSPSNVKLINSRIPTNGAAATIDGNSTFLDDTTASKDSVRGFATDQAYVKEQTVNGSVFFSNGVFTGLGTPLCTYRQINNTVFFTISVTCASTSAGTGTIILDVLYTVLATATGIHGSAFAGSTPALVYRHSSTRIRADMTAAAGQTSVLFGGQINLVS